MCFSPEADLTTGVIAGAIGIDALRHASRPQQPGAMERIPSRLCDGHGFPRAFPPLRRGRGEVFRASPSWTSQPIEDDTVLRHARRAAATCPRRALLLQGLTLPTRT